MTDQVQICVDRDIYEQLQVLMVPPVSDANAVIRELLFHEGHGNRSSLALKAAAQHYTYTQEIERSKAGIYDCGGGT